MTPVRGTGVRTRVAGWLGSGQPPADTEPLVRELTAVKKQVRRLRSEVTELQGEVQECRRLNRRLAELTDIVQELLLPISQQDDAKVHELLTRYSDSL